MLATILAGCTWTAHAADQAAPQTWNFSYTGFNLTYRHFNGVNNVDQTTTECRSDHVHGSFSSIDNNQDGIIDLSELTTFSFKGMDYYGCTFSPEPYSQCAIANFSYALTGQLDFSVSH